MTTYGIWQLWLLVLIVGQGTAISYNQPKFCSNASWNSTALTFATSNIVGGTPYGIFVNTQNTVYVADRQDSRLHVWLEGSTTPIRNISTGLAYPYSVVVADGGDIYIDNGYSNNRVDQWRMNSSSSVPAMYTCGRCDDLFIDVSNNLYCSMYNNHQVLGKSLSVRLNLWSIVAGTGSSGSTAMTLSYPRGIFVDQNLNLYVADYNNHRVQQFPFGQVTATTVAGAAAPGTITLTYPTDVALDADGYLFIVDSGVHRIVGSSASGFRCIAGCSGGGSTASSMNNPSTFSFDSYGNIFITDRDNNRVQKFLLASNTCGLPPVTTTTVPPSSTTSSSASNSYANVISYNRPKFGAYATWSGNAITFATSATVGAEPYGMFIDRNNTVYVADRADRRLPIWLQGSTIPTNTITIDVGYPCSVFVTLTGDIYLDSGYGNSRVDKYTASGTVRTPVMSVKYICYDMFIDVNNNLYCTLYDYHQVTTISLNTNSSMMTVAAGTYCAGSTSNQLYYPRGMYVDTNLNLYVADCGNNRVQLFQSGQLVATTIAGSAAAGTIPLNCPTDVALDADGYVFIVDSLNHRVVGSGPNGFRCIVGCSNAAGSSSTQLSTPSGFSFDSYGNIFVVDRMNYRVQKFILQPNTIYPLSMNQPYLCPSATWYTDGVTFADSTIIGTNPYGVFVSSNNTVYGASYSFSRVHVWLEGSIFPDRNISGGLSGPVSVFATVSGDVYVDNGVSYLRVDKWSPNSTTSVPVLTITEECYDLFVDISNTLYCSMTFSHRVAKKWAAVNETTLTLAAGVGGSGSAANQLTYPCGLHVDYQFNLYVGDCGNNRIQKFVLGQENGITIAGNGAPGTITLSCPNDIAFDASGYLFITDNYNHRLIGSGPFGFRCLFGCTQIAGSAPSQLYYPRTFSFDSYGNIFVADQVNNRIQKFLLASNSCSISYSQPKFCAVASWLPNATTLTSSSTIGSYPYGIFVDGINTVYVASQQNNTVLIWPQYSSTPTQNRSAGLIRPYGLFVSMTGDLYVDNGYLNGRVDKFASNTSNVVTVMNVNASCYGLFIDSMNNLYCSLKYLHQVVKLLLGNGTTTPSIAAGNTTAGSASNMLNLPHGIYVDGNLNLYIADCGNDRIQQVQTGQTDGVTVVGNGTSSTIPLDCPTAVVLDSDGYLFIVDSYNHRIIGSGYYGYRCIVGCSGGNGASSSQLSFPQSMAFDSYGNIYVTDQNNSRVQVFSFQKINCTTPTTVQTTVPPSTNPPQTTVASTTLAMQTSSISTTSILQTTSVGTTSGQQTTQLPLTSAVETTGFPTTSAPITTAAPTTSAPVTTAAPTTSAPVTTAAPPTSPEITTAVPTTSASVTTAAPTTSAPVTTDPPTTSPDITTAVPTTSASVTTAAPPTSPEMTTAVPTTSASVTTAAPTTSAPATTAAPTTSPEITTAAPTTSPAITTAVPTTSAPVTTSSLQTTMNPSTSSVTTTLIPTTSSPETTMSPSTSRPLTSAIETTDIPAMSSVQTTTLLMTTQVSSTSAVQSTAAASSSPSKTTVPPTTSGIQTTTVSSLGTAQTSDSTPTQEHTTQASSTAAVLTTNGFNFKGCYPPLITLIPGESSFTSPLQFRRSQDFSIASTIGLRCNATLSTAKVWIVKNCTSTCQYPIQLSDKISTTSSELYLPSRTLAYGLYQLVLTVTMVGYPNAKASSSVYAMITPSGITANLVPLGTSMITRGNEQDLLLDPGTYSVDPDEDSFNASKWKFEYYCRLFGPYNFPNFQGRLLSIENSKTDPVNPSCLSNRSDGQIGLIFGNLTASPKSSLTVLSGTLRPNHTYQFVAYLENRKNASIQATGYVLVTVEQTRPRLVVIGCVISTLCQPNLEFQLVNPTTQVALFAFCVGTCANLLRIQWNVYQGGINSSSNTTQWILFSQMATYENTWFFGTNTSNFTASDQLFLHNSQISLWRFEVVYTFAAETSTSALNFLINQSPYNGSCAINPRQGTTTTPFSVSCPGWFDEDEIKDYALYAWTTDVSAKVMVAFSSVSTFVVQLPAGAMNTSLLHVVILIRDRFDCVTAVNMSAIPVVVDSAGVDDLTKNIQDSSAAVASNPVIQLLASGNQNTVGQVITSLSQQLNQMNGASIDKAVSSGVPAASVSVSALGSESSTGTVAPVNESALAEYKKELNSQANVRDYVIPFIVNLSITTSNSIQLQSSSLAQLTQSTNQLTRAALGLASNKCYQLSVALYSMARRIPYEDVKQAASQLMQCASNVLTGVNGPLQKRTNSLDLDLSRASDIASDYDTDIESEWSKLNALAGGGSTSSEEQRNIYYQKKLADDIQRQVTETISLVTSSLTIHLNIGQSSLINTSQAFVSLETISLQSLSNRIVKQVGSAAIHIPSNFSLNTTDNTSISLRSKMDPLAAYGNFPNTNLSRSVSLTVVDQNGQEVPFQTDSTTPLRIIIPRDPSVLIPPMYFQNVTSRNATLSNLVFHLHYINITSVLPISVHFEVRPSNASVAYLFIYKFDQTPQLNSSINLIDGWTLFCPSKLTVDNIYTFFLNNQQTSGHLSLIFGIRQLNAAEIEKYCAGNSSGGGLPVTDQPFNFTADYELRIYTSGCYYLNENNLWKSEGLVVGPSTNHYETECLSTHLTTFAGGFIVLPAPINWSYVFANADFMKNKTVYLTIICTLALYILLMIYARFKDKKDFEKLGVAPLADNQKSDQYFYQILVFTGQRTNAGTESKVRFVLSGEDDQTEIRAFSDSRRKIFQRGSIDAFIMAVPKSLGLLNYIRIWHDNSGVGASASWYLKYILVRDLQTMEKFYFISQQWFAVEQDDGRIERTLPVAGESEKQNFSYVLSKKAYHSVSDGHLWFSIFSRPPSNKFTRVQRCTSCFVLFFTAMLLNIMYYDVANEAKAANQTQANGLSIGPLYITPQQIGIGVMVELLTFLPSIFIVQFFRRIRPRQQISPLRQALYDIKSPRHNLETTGSTRRKSSSRTFPWWCLFIAYAISFLIIAVSILFIIARGIQFGDTKTQKWLTSVLTGFFSSILLTQPIKILCLAAFFAFFCRKSAEDKEASEYIDDDEIELCNDTDDSYLHSTEIQGMFNPQTVTSAGRLKENELHYAREQRLKELQMWSIVREFATYVIFIVLIFLITFASREQNSFQQVNHLRTYFFNTRQSSVDYTKISTVDQYWGWLQNSFVDNLRAQQWYNGDGPRYLNGFINDKSNRLIGWAMMRQLRIKPELCSDQRLVSMREHDYSIFNEDKRSFQPGWTNETAVGTYSSSILKAFKYVTSDELDTHIYVGEYGTYRGGGYVYEFRGSLSEMKGNLSELHQLDWIDEKTRAVFIQLTLYNPNVNLLTAATFLAEFLPTGGIFLSARFEPINFYTFSSVLQIICTVLYMCFIIYFMSIEIRSISQLRAKYFRQFWSLIQLGIIGCSWGSVAVYIWRFREAGRISALFEQTNGYVYVNLQLAAYVNDVLTYLLGYCCFFGTIQVVHLFRFNHRVSLFTETLRFAAMELLMFFVMFSIVFMAYVSLFYLLFVSKFRSCSSLMNTAQMLFEMTLMKFDASELIAAGAFLGPFCFTLFIFVVVFICLSMFLSIINDSFRRAKTTRIEDQIILSFMWKKFLQWTGWRKPSQAERQEDYDRRMRSLYFDPIENFPQRIDQLLTALDKIYIGQKAELSRLNRAGV